VIALIVGIPLGILMGRSIVADRIFLPWVNLFLSAPLSALVPVIMVIFGFGQTTIILTVVLFAIWIIVLDARAGARSITPSLIEMTRSFGANRWQTFFKVLVWAALPEILAGIRLGMIRAVKGVVIAALYDRRFRPLVRNSFPALPDGDWALLFVLFASLSPSTRCWRAAIGFRRRPELN
jgi:NitT/TauT family transport system permease protein